MPITEKPIRAILVSHTHWDRAWYLPFETFRFRLVYLIDRVIELLQNDPEYRCFVLDGQTILIEDYLEIKPENKEILQNLISDERLIIGPWYVLPDLFLVSGEAIIRNLQYGQQMCEIYGNGMNVGYVPDPFGHIAQLPQILNGFGLETFIFMRGMPEELSDKDTLLFNWHGQDENSTVLAYYLKDGYYNAAALGYDTIQGRYDVSRPSGDKAKKSVNKTKEILSRNHPHDLILLNNGVDHMPEQPEIPRLIESINSNGSQIHLIQGSFGDFMEEAAKNPVNDSYRGNLIGNPDHPILLNVYSTRVYLKQQNHRAQYMLEKVAEPLLLFNSNRDPDTNIRFLDFAWKTLLKNHPHDDICGCSADEVHEENEVRFSKVKEVSGALIDQTLEEMVKSGFTTSVQNYPEDGHTRLMVFNPHPFRLKGETIETTIHIKNPQGKEEEYDQSEQKLLAFNSEGESVDIYVSGSRGSVMRAGYISHQWGREYTVELHADLPPLGYEIFSFVAVEDQPVNRVAKCSKQTVTNVFAVLSFEEGRLKWKHKKADLEAENLLQFEYMGDEGDTYSFSPAEDSRIVFEEGNFNAGKSNNRTIVANYCLDVPENPESRERVEIHIEVSASLRSDGSVSIRADYENRAENGRLRMVLPCLSSVNESVSDGHFTLNYNTVKPQQNPADHPERYNSYPGEMLYTTHYQGDFSFVKNGRTKTWVANKGLHEYEIIEESEESHFAVTLHRAVGYLSVSNGKIRRPQAGPSIPTPGAQCKRKLSAELCWGVSKKGLDELLVAARTFSHPPFARQLPEIEHSPENGPVPQSQSLMKIDNPMIQLSSLHGLHSTGDIVLRIWNPSNEIQKTKIRPGFKATYFCKTSLKEEWREDDKQSLKDNSADLIIKPNEIVTLRFRDG